MKHQCPHVNYEKLAKYLNRKFGIVQETRILELGSGLGYLADELEGYSYYVKRIKGKEELPIKGKYDLIIIHSVLQYIGTFYDKLRFIEEAYKHLNKNGSIWIGDISNKDTNFKDLQRHYPQCEFTRYPLLTKGKFFRKCLIINKT